ncbi:MAG: glycosyltransferase family 4 protein [Lachnospiraceae bacterium]|nr:glycosyltransferase family 4 protein [Lachnospiraceae bacterium]
MNKRKMNVLLVSAKVRAGGEAVHVTTLAKEFLKKGLGVSLLSTDPEGGMMAGIIPKENVFYTEFRDHNPVQVAKNVGAIRSLLASCKFDIIHCHGRDNAFAVKMAHPAQPYVFTCHSMSVQTDFLHRMLNSTGDAAIAVSGSTRKFMIDSLGIPADRITVIENGVDPSELKLLTEDEKLWLRRRFLIPEGKIVAAIHGRIDPRKNHAIIGRALAGLPREEREKFVVLVSGDRDVPGYAPLVGQLRDLGVLAQFRFTGWTEPRNILGCSDILLAPSLVESFMMSALEAFFMEVPVVRSKTGGYEEMKDFCIGLDADDLEGWKGMLHRVSECGTDDMKPMIQRAGKEAMKRYTSEMMAGKVYEVYREAIRRRRAGS